MNADRIRKSDSSQAPACIGAQRGAQRTPAGKRRVSTLSVLADEAEGGGRPAPLRSRLGNGVVLGWRACGRPLPHGRGSVLALSALVLLPASRAASRVS